jgi:Berberine and berberine like
VHNSANYGRLLALKGEYDPTNLFRLNQNIRPLSQAASDSTPLSIRRASASEAAVPTTSMSGWLSSNLVKARRKSARSSATRMRIISWSFVAVPLLGYGYTKIEAGAPLIVQVFAVAWALPVALAR